jgi:hypothetical protein
MQGAFWIKSTRIFIKMESSAFVENFKQVPLIASSAGFRKFNMVSALVTIGRGPGAAASRQLKFHHDPQIAVRSRLDGRRVNRLGFVRAAP